MAEPVLPQGQPAAMAPPASGTGALGWLRQNLFNSWLNALLTLVTAWILYKVIRGGLGWALTRARWDAVALNLRIFMVGGYPAEQLWRVWTAVALAAFLAGVSWGAWGRLTRSGATGLAAALLTLLVLPVSTPSRLWITGAVALVVLGAAVGARIPARGRSWLIPAWVLQFALSLLLIGGAAWLPGLPVVRTNLWNGLLLTLLLALSGIVFCFPLGVLLALGRQSSLPALRWVSIAYIELIRAVPLITILFMAQLLVPLFMPEGIRLDNVLRAWLGITLFSAAYMAENVRGGLQAVPRGQMEAARALGLKGWQAILLILLPQALRMVIPAIVGQFISMLKDTSLVVIVSLTDLMGIAKTVLAQPGFVTRHFEVYLFVAAVYFVFSYSLSIGSRRLEKALGVGER